VSSEDLAAAFGPVDGVGASAEVGVPPCVCLAETSVAEHVGGADGTAADRVSLRLRTGRNHDHGSGSGSGLPVLRAGVWYVVAVQCDAPGFTSFWQSESASPLESPSSRTSNEGQGQGRGRGEGGGLGSLGGLDAHGSSPASSAVRRVVMTRPASTIAGVVGSEGATPGLLEVSFRRAAGAIEMRSSLERGQLPGVILGPTP